jgi:hypothetical protein
MPTITLFYDWPLKPLDVVTSKRCHWDLLLQYLQHLDNKMSNTWIASTGICCHNHRSCPLLPILTSEYSICKQRPIHTICNFHALIQTEIFRNLTNFALRNVTAEIRGQILQNAVAVSVWNWRLSCEAKSSPIKKKAINNKHIEDIVFWTRVTSHTIWRCP